MNDYRECAAPPPVEAIPSPPPDPTALYLGGGTLVRTPPSCKCTPPGWWARHKLKVREDDFWRCSCGKWFKWSGMAALGWFARGEGLPHDLPSKVTP